MSLVEQVDQLIGQWHGLDATERTARRQQLVADLVSLVQAELAGQVRPQAQAPVREPTPMCTLCVPRYFAPLVQAGLAMWPGRPAEREKSAA